MATTSKSEKILIGIDNEVVELTGKDKETFIADKEASAQVTPLIEAENKAKQDSRESAIKK